jgi:hypothetical protein
MTIDAVRKVVLANEYAVDKWLLPALNEIARRNEPIGVDDVTQLGLECALKLAQVRESLSPTTETSPGTRRYCNSCGCSCYGCGGNQSLNRAEYDFTAEIRRVFNIT